MARIILGRADVIARGWRQPATRQTPEPGSRAGFHAEDTSHARDDRTTLVRTVV